MAERAERVRADVVVISSAIVDPAPAGGAAHAMANATLEAVARDAGVRSGRTGPG